MIDAESDQQGLAVLVLAQPERMKRLREISSKFEPATVTITVFPEPLRKDNIARVRAEISM